MELKRFISLCLYKRELLVVRLVILIMVASATTPPCVGQDLTSTTPAPPICASSAAITKTWIVAGNISFFLNFGKHRIGKYWIDICEDNKLVKSEEINETSGRLEKQITLHKDGTIYRLRNSSGIVASYLLTFGSYAFCYLKLNKRKNFICELPNPNNSLILRMETDLMSRSTTSNCSDYKSNKTICKTFSDFGVNSYTNFIHIFDTNSNKSYVHVIQQNFTQNVIVDSIQDVFTFPNESQVIVEIEKHPQLVYWDNLGHHRPIECEFYYMVPNLEITQNTRIFTINTLPGKEYKTIDNLIPHQQYNLSIRCRTNRTLDLWCDAINVTFKTLPAAPILPPETLAGAYYIDSHNITLFWKSIPNYLHNGTNLCYVLSQTNRKFKDPRAVLEWDGKTKNYLLQTSNDKGASLKSSQISVYAHSMEQHKPINLRYLVSNKTYIIRWEAPKAKGVIHYTLLWCEGTAGIRTKCAENGIQNLTYISANMTEFSVTVIPNMSYNMALSANYANTSSGLNWVECNYEWIRTITKIEIMKTSGSYINLSLTSEVECRMPGEKQILEYAENKDFKNSMEIRVYAPKDTSTFNYTLSDLKPHTEYFIRTKRLRKNQLERMSFNAVHQKTIDNVPTPPSHLTYSNVTSSSVNLNWEPPRTLGVGLLNYTVYYRNLNDGKEQKRKVNETHLLLDSLESYTEYEVYLTAENMFSSNRTKPIKITTLMDVPGKPTIIYEGSKGYLNWAKPIKPSGRVDFYIVNWELTNGTHNLDSSFEPVLEKSYKLHTQEIGMIYIYRVMAINLVKPEEYGNTSNLKDIPSESINPLQFTPMQCLNNGSSILLDKDKYDYVMDELDRNLDIKDRKQVKFLCSEWSEQPYTWSISLPSIWENLKYPFLMICPCLIIAFSLWGRRLFKKQEIMPKFPPEIQNVVDAFNKETKHVSTPADPIFENVQNPAVSKTNTNPNCESWSFSTLLSNITGSTENLQSSSLSPILVGRSVDKDLLSSESYSLEYHCENPITSLGNSATVNYMKMEIVDSIQKSDMGEEYLIMDNSIES